MAAVKTAPTENPAPLATASATASLRKSSMWRLNLGDEGNKNVDVGGGGRCFGAVGLFDGEGVVTLRKAE